MNYKFELKDCLILKMIFQKVELLPCVLRKEKITLL